MRYTTSLLSVLAMSTVHLAVQITAGAIEITWTEPGAMLQQSTDVKTWTDVPTATSPYRPAMAGTTASFYRLKK